jgi:hypothetical protein
VLREDDEGEDSFGTAVQIARRSGALKGIEAPLSVDEVPWRDGGAA